MTAVYLLDIPENHPIVAVGAAQPGVLVERRGPYLVLTSEESIVIDRRATGARHAVWYSSVAGLRNARITNWDKNDLRADST